MVEDQRRLSHLVSPLRTRFTPSTMALALAIATCRAVCENPQSGVTDTRAASTYLSTRPQSVGHQLGRLDPGILDVDQSHGDIHRLGQLSQELDLGQLAAGELECQLIDRARPR